jgi:hypothetical protein
MSPYENASSSNWGSITEELINEYPLSMDEIVEAVLNAWDGIFKTKIAGELQIGVDIFPSPQIIGNYLHELIPIEIEKMHPGEWSRDIEKDDKDLVYLPDRKYSAEIKTSSNANNIYGNASYGQEDSSNSSAKSKDGYYIAVNFDKLRPNDPNFKPEVRKIRFGWLDHKDWHSQAASSGQQSHIPPEVRDNKLKLIYIR